MNRSLHFYLESRASPEAQTFFDKLDVTNPVHADYYLPMFGDSPGGTPSVSSAPSIADSRSDLDDISDVSACIIISSYLVDHTL